MKVICQCGFEVRYEPPFDDFHVERVPCSQSCRVMNANYRCIPIIVMPEPQLQQQKAAP